MSGFQVDETAAGISLGEQAYLQLKADILSCKLAPDSIVSLGQLADDLGMGKAPVRSALERLSAEDLVAAIPYKGFRVVPISLQDVLQLYDVAAAIFPALARLSAGKIGAEYDRLMDLSAICDAPTPPKTEEDEVAIISAGRELLLTVRACSENTYALMISQKLGEQIDRVVALLRSVSGKPVDFRRDNRPLIEALSLGDADAAEAASKVLVATMRHKIVDSFLSSPAITSQSLTGKSPRARTRRGRKSTTPRSAKE